jgi:hypothetical protein
MAALTAATAASTSESESELELELESTLYPKRPCARGYRRGCGCGCGSGLGREYVSGWRCRSQYHSVSGTAVSLWARRG